MNNLVVTPKRFLSELLPYDISTKINGSLRTSLREYSLLLTAMEQAIIALQKGDFEQFDALVGENACQIRAVKIAMTAQKYLESVKAIQAKITNSKLKIETLSKCLEPLMKRGVSLQSLLEQEEIDIVLTEDELFLMESFLLSVAKTVNPPKPSSPLKRNDITDYKKLKQYGSEVSASFMNELVKRTKQLLSVASVAFVQEQATFLNNEQLEKKCAKNFILNCDGRLCIPMFWTYKTLLLAAQKKEIPIVIYAKFLTKDRKYSTVEEECIVFRPTADSQSSFYEELVPYPNDLTKAAIFIQGAVCANSDVLPSKSQWRKTIRAQKLEDIILAGAADHRQYPDPDEDRRIEELKDKEFDEYRIKARNEGYALENPTLFFIQHVYTATIGSLPQLIQKTKLAEALICSFLPKHCIAEWPQRAVTRIMYYLEN